ncbi:MAG: hypothetical protein WCD86_10705, partial [Ktedonobacteraceae bacterium]
ATGGRAEGDHYDKARYNISVLPSDSAIATFFYHSYVVSLYVIVISVLRRLSIIASNSLDRPDRLCYAVSGMRKPVAGIMQAKNIENARIGA